MYLTGKTVLVTGAQQGIGRAIALGLSGIALLYILVQLVAQGVLGNTLAAPETAKADPQRTVFQGLNSIGGKPNDNPATPYSFAGTAWDNWYLKHQYALSRKGLDQLAGLPPEAAAVAPSRDRCARVQSSPTRPVCRHRCTARSLCTLRCR